MPLTVGGKKIDLLVDSGAAHSVITGEDAISVSQLKVTDKSRCTVGATGHSAVEYFSEPMKCETEEGRIMMHSFLISENCPINLLGRDLMCALGLSLTSSPDGVVVTESSLSCPQLGQEEELHELLKLYPKLTEVPQTLWAKTKYDVGLIKNAEPVVITPKSSFRPRKAQYPLKPEALEGIKPVFHSLLKAGIIVPCNDSPVRTPQPDDWRFVQDLQAVNAAVVQRAPDVPNPYTILSQIPSNCKWFSVVDLANAFFSIPVHKDSQFWFAFKFGDRCFTFTRLCQGFCDAPTIFNQTLKNSLDSLVLSQNSAICCYVDDIILASTTQQQC
uniref:ribonuclease H n=1 Tax=Astyanax mexicanus TaxID=7994 RepID=A0A8B9J4Y7_ASTMX